MKKLFVFLALVIAFNSSSNARGVDLFFDEVRLVDLARLVFGEIVKKPYILSTAFLASPDTVTLSLRDSSESQVIEHLSFLLESSGYTLKRHSGVFSVEVLKKPSEIEDEPFLYHPKFRSVGYLQDVLSGVFKSGAFGSQRAVQNPLNMYAPVAANQSPVTKQSGQQYQPPVTVPVSPTSALAGLDKNLDVLVFKGTPKDVLQLEQLLARLDIPTSEIIVKAVVYEVHTEGSEKSALGLIASLLGGKLAINVGKVAAGDYSVLAGIGGVQVVIDALQSDRRFKVVSSPSIRVQSGASARLQVGSETPVLSQAQLDRVGNPVQSVEYRPSGVILDLKPQIRGEVADLTINQQISNFIPTTTGVSGSPTLLKRELTTSVGVRSGDVLILGGLDENRGTVEKSGLSFLPAIFRASSDQSSKSEILLIMQADRI